MAAESIPTQLMKGQVDLENIQLVCNKATEPRLAPQYKLILFHRLLVVEVRDVMRAMHSML